MLNYYSWWVGGGWVGQKKTKLMLYSTLVEIEVEVGVELGNDQEYRGQDSGEDGHQNLY